jgi:hypothetical protein
VNAVNRWGASPLIFAVLKMHTEVALVLLDLGADRTKKVIGTLGPDQGPEASRRPSYEAPALAVSARSFQKRNMLEKI